MSTPVGTLQVQRRTWDVDEYQKKAEDRRAQEDADEAAADAASKKTFSGTIVQRDHLDVSRSRKGNQVDINALVGKTQVVTGNTPIQQSGGFYCTVCQCLVKDSISWLDHVNGKKHNRALGMNMRVERSSVEQVQKRFKTVKPSDRHAAKPVDSERSALEELDAKIDALREEEERAKEAKRDAKKAKRDEAEAAKKEGLADGFEEMMGFGGFGNKKK
mmetsp:Transcript_44930/g.70421  ORF Transcript_44930/g.70421 Transcript_44930/m.70421 type:complete len:217 (+) Transcript_44930:158-808(+)|eukprot:CAMPEP_0184296514 /NCGR_PEP_ID=MMETSP1049-20130417/7489_1 /TAXON_ID=77928 /ORGANISM="Proteomonas sulcata, Strain CCMP704" /LENGTH=216 /DNA_ID=CAMNT_0026605793 /DNA_START=147 /DNA_END=797 /DNA_ORIENTATION=-